MFTYINDNFLHAPSTDLSREVVRALTKLMLAQAQEVFLEMTVMGAEGKEKKSWGMMSKLASGAAGMYEGVVEEMKEQVIKGIFEASWSILVQVSRNHC